MRRSRSGEHAAARWRDDRATPPRCADADADANANEHGRGGCALTLPAGLLLAYYGDDFTGSTDVLDAFAAAGVPTVLFFEPPTAADLQQFAAARCIGLAGTARSRGPAWMAAQLPGAFDALARLGPPLLQYKVCSTFDSSPEVGSIGRAIDLGLARFGAEAGWSPVIVGAPPLRRYQAFGHLFAAAGDGVVHRLDRHPTMQRHPVTPMGESDLRAHLARQTSRRIELIDFVQLKAGRGAERLAALRGDDVPIVLLDVIDDESLAAAGRLVWEQRGSALFSASSSGLDHALAAHWRQLGTAGEWPPGGDAAAPADPHAGRDVRCVGVSGSCSPVTAAQIAVALASGRFDGLRVDVAATLQPAGLGAEVERLVACARAALRAGRAPLVYSARGPDDPAVGAFDAAAARAGLSRDEAAACIGRALGQVLRHLLDEEPALTRLLVVGGDSSGAVVSALGLRGLTVARPLAPGAPLCWAFSHDARRKGLELVLKGGQMGSQRFFLEAAEVQGRHAEASNS
ncbi:MAG: four-carbon acid sugar kinase family protein [Rubrivivax sp.]|nr:four-carbon acid sugar kinase family protein [Rubrivivax sp.]